MKRLILLFCLLPCIANATDRQKLDEMLANAAMARGRNYLEARQVLMGLGRDVLPLLSQATTDPKLTWQQRLAARISYERGLREKDIEALRRYDWRTHPQYDKRWEESIVGVKDKLGRIAVPKFIEAGLWYYFIELGWKDTTEFALEPKDPRINSTHVFPDSWIGWCFAALQNQPERLYLVEALVESLELDATLSGPLTKAYYSYLLSNKETNAVPVLIERVEAYVKGTRPTLSPENLKKATLWELGNVLAFADSRHADFIEQFLAEHPDYSPLTNRLAAVRARPASPPQAEPAFRLGQQVVKP